MSRIDANQATLLEYLYAHREELTWDPNPRAKYADGTPAKSLSAYDKNFFYEDISQVAYSLRKTALNDAVKEIFWIYQMQSNKLSDLNALGVKYWDSWDVGDGTIGKRYGYIAARSFNKFLDNLVKDPFSKRHYFSLWQNEPEGPGLLPCAHSFSINIIDFKGERKVYFKLFQRSQDILTAMPINAAQYFVLMLMICGHLTHTTGISHTPIRMVHNIDNVHIYDRHIDLIEELLESIEDHKIVTKVVACKEPKNFFDYTPADFKFTQPKDTFKLSRQVDLAI